MPADEMKQHIHDCPKRQVRCRNGCNAQMEQRYRNNHEQQMCTHRTVEVTVVLCRRVCVCVAGPHVVVGVLFPPRSASGAVGIVTSGS